MLNKWTNWAGPEDIVNALYERQGNLLLFLTDFAGEDTQEQNRLLFDILYVLKEDEEYEKKWNKLLEIHQEQHLMMAESRLLSAGLIDAKPEKIINILERLQPQRWAKKSVNRKEKKEENPYERHLSS